MKNRVLLEYPAHQVRPRPDRVQGHVLAAVRLVLGSRAVEVDRDRRIQRLLYRIQSRLRHGPLPSSHGAGTVHVAQRRVGLAVGRQRRVRFGMPVAIVLRDQTQDRIAPGRITDDRHRMRMIRGHEHERVVKIDLLQRDCHCPGEFLGLRQRVTGLVVMVAVVDAAAFDHQVVATPLRLEQIDGRRRHP